MRALTLLISAALACACATPPPPAPRSAPSLAAGELTFDAPTVIVAAAPSDRLRRFVTRDGSHDLLVAIGSYAEADEYAALEGFAAEVGSCDSPRQQTLRGRPVVAVHCGTEREVREALAFATGPWLVLGSCRAARHAAAPDRCSELLGTLRVPPTPAGRHPVRLARAVPRGARFALDVTLRRSARAHAAARGELQVERSHSAAIEARIAGRVLELDEAGVPLRVRYVIERADATRAARPVEVAPGSALVVDFRDGGPRVELETPPSSPDARELLLALGEAAFWPQADRAGSRDAARAIDDTWPVSPRVAGEGRHRLVGPVACAAGECLEVETVIALAGATSTRVRLRARYPQEPRAPLPWQAYQKRERSLRALSGERGASVEAVVETVAETHLHWAP